MLVVLVCLLLDVKMLLLRVLLLLLLEVELL